MGVPPRVKELKVILPTQVYWRLRAHKLLHGETIASSVEKALDAHFARVERRRAGPPGPGGEEDRPPD